MPHDTARSCVPQLGHRRRRTLNLGIAGKSSVRVDVERLPDHILQSNGGAGGWSCRMSQRLKQEVECVRPEADDEVVLLRYVLQRRRHCRRQCEREHLAHALSQSDERSVIVVLDIDDHVLLVLHNELPPSFRLALLRRGVSRCTGTTGPALDENTDPLSIALAIICAFAFAIVA